MNINFDTITNYLLSDDIEVFVLGVKLLELLPEDELNKYHKMITSKYPFDHKLSELSETFKVMTLSEIFENPENTFKHLHMISFFDFMKFKRSGLKVTDYSRNFLWNK